LIINVNIFLEKETSASGNSGLMFDLDMVNIR